MKRYAKDGPTASGNAETQLQSFIGKFEPKNQALIHAVRIALRKRLPSANELVYDNYNFFVIGYSSTERPSDSIVSRCADCGSSVRSDCQMECCESFCGQCYDYHLMHRCLRKPIHAEYRQQEKTKRA